MSEGVDLHAELERLRSELASKDEQLKQEQGLAKGKVRCLTRGCTQGETSAEYKRADAVRYFKDIQGNETMVPENTTVMWELQGDEKCPKCSVPLSQVQPGARSAFPEGHVFMYPEPVRG